MTLTQVTNKLKTNPSYLKCGDQRIATTFNCSVKTARAAKKSLIGYKRKYIKSLA